MNEIKKNYVGETENRWIVDVVSINIIHGIIHCERCMYIIDDFNTDGIIFTVFPGEIF